MHPGRKSQRVRKTIFLKACIVTTSCIPVHRAFANPTLKMPLDSLLMSDSFSPLQLVVILLHLCPKSVKLLNLALDTSAKGDIPKLLGDFCQDLICLIINRLGLIKKLGRQVTNDRNWGNVGN